MKVKKGKGESACFFLFPFYFYAMNSKKILFLFVTLLFLSVTLLVLARPVALSLSAFLSKSEKADANILVIEGWLSQNDLKHAIDEFKSGTYEYIIITGIRSTPKYYNVNSHGYLIFYTGKYSSVPVTTIGVRARSELDGEHSAQFNLWVNDSVMGSFTADKRTRVYSVQCDGSAADSVIIQFTNDKMGEFGDRNLFISEVIINGKIIIPFLNNSVYDISDLDNKNRIVNDMNSNSELTAKRLYSLGIDTSRIISIPGRKVIINRTLTSALALRDWMRESDIEISGINIVSSGTHSRRTWLTFSRVLNRSVKVGIISLSDTRNTGSDGIGYIKTLRETIAYIYYSILLIPY